jgi:hypothetical protein
VFKFADKDEADYMLGYDAGYDDSAANKKRDAKKKKNS